MKGRKLTYAQRTALQILKQQPTDQRDILMKGPNAATLAVLERNKLVQRAEPWGMWRITMEGVEAESTGRYQPVKAAPDER